MDDEREAKITTSALEAYLHASGSSLESGALDSSLTLGQVRAELRRDNARTDELRKKVRESESERFAFDMRSLRARQQHERVDRQKQHEYLFSIREKEKQHQETEFQATVEREKLKKKLRTMDESRLHNLREEQQRMMHMLHKEHDSLKAQEVAARGHIEELEMQLNSEEEKLRERFENLASEAYLEEHATEGEIGEATRLLELAQRYGSRKVEIRRNQEALEEELKKSKVKLSEVRSNSGVLCATTAASSAEAEASVRGEALDALVDQVTAEEAMEAAQRNLREMKSRLKEEDVRYREYSENEVDQLLTKEYGRLVTSLPIVKERSDRLQRLVKNAPPLLLREQLSVNHDPNAELDRWLMSERASLLSEKRTRIECEETEPGIDEAEKDRADLHRSRQRSDSALENKQASVFAAQSDGSQSPACSVQSRQSGGSFGDYRQYCDVPIHGSESRSEEAKRHLNSIRMRLLRAERGSLNREELLAKLQDLERAVLPEQAALEPQQQFDEYVPNPNDVKPGYHEVGRHSDSRQQQAQPQPQPRPRPHRLLRHPPQRDMSAHEEKSGTETYMFMWMMQQQQASAAAAAEAQQRVLLRDIEKQAAQLEGDNVKLQIEIEHARHGVQGDSISMTQRVRELTDRHDEDMAKIRYEREKLEQQAALEAVREKLEHHREEQTRKREHDAYMEEATRQIQAQRLEKVRAKEAPLVRDIGSSASDKAYDPRCGVNIFFDFVGSLPKSLRNAPTGLSEIRLAYALFSTEPHESGTGDEAGVDLRTSEFTEVEFNEKESVGFFAIINEVSLFGKSPPSHLVQSTSTILIELRGKPVAPNNTMRVQNMEREITVGWCFLNLMDDERLNIGRHCVKLIPGHFHGSKTNYVEAYQRLQQPQSGGFSGGLYLRVLSAGSEPPLQSIDPSLCEHLYSTQPPQSVPQHRQEEPMSQPRQQSLQKPTLIESADQQLPESAVLQQRQQVEEDMQEPEKSSLPSHNFGVSGSMGAKLAGQRWRSWARARRQPAATASILRIRSVHIRGGRGKALLALGVRFVRASQSAPIEDVWVSIMGSPVSTDSEQWTWKDQMGGNQIELPPDAEKAQMRVYEAPPSTAPWPHRVSQGDLRTAVGAPIDIHLQPQPQPGQRALPLNDGFGASLGTVLIEFLQSSLPADEILASGRAEQASQEEIANALDDLEEEPSLEIDGNTPELWLDVDKSPVQRSLFARGDGFDIYIDGARQLPANVSITSVSIKVLTSGGDLEEEVAISSLGPTSTVMNPEYNHRKEYRDEDLKDMDFFDPRAVIMFKVTTVVARASLHESRLNAGQRRGGAPNDSVKKCVGYALFNAFVDRSDSTGAGRKQPQDSNERDYALNEGSFQLSLTQAHPPMEFFQRKLLDAAALDEVPHTPCATLLIRVVKAKKSKDGLTTLTRVDCNEEEWASLGLLDIPPPDGGYQSKAYDSQRSKPTAEERKIYDSRRTKQNKALDIRVADVAREAMAADDPQRSRGSFTDDEMRAWMRQKLTGEPRVKSMIDFTAVNQYRPDLGVSIAIDSFVNMVPSKKGWQSGSGAGSAEIYKAVYFITPPAFFKENPPLTEDAHFTRELDLDSPLTAPRYRDGLVDFRNLAFNESTLLLIEVRRMRKMGKKRKGLPLGSGFYEIAPPSEGYWTAIPLFLSHTFEGRGNFPCVATGGYVLPLFEGAIPEAFIDLSKSPGWYLSTYR